MNQVEKLEYEAPASLCVRLAAEHHVLGGSSTPEVQSSSTRDLGAYEDL